MTNVFTTWGNIDDFVSESGLEWEPLVPEPKTDVPEGYTGTDVILTEKRIIHRWGRKCCLLYYSDGHVESWYWQRCPYYSYQEGYHIAYRIYHEGLGLGMGTEQYWEPDWPETWVDEFDSTWPCWSRPEKLTWE